MFPSLLVIDTSLYPFGPEPESVTETITVTDTKLPFGGQSVLGCGLTGDCGRGLVQARGHRMIRDPLY
jgi:hypothetical protein